MDHPPCIQAEIGRRESSHRRRPDSCQRVHGEIPGMLGPAAPLCTRSFQTDSHSSCGGNEKGGETSFFVVVDVAGVQA